jgi:hypothetical protein
MSVLVDGVRKAASDNGVERLAGHAGISPGLVRHLAGVVGLSPGVFVKRAYADPDDFVAFLKQAAGAGPAGVRGFLTALLQKIQAKGAPAFRPSPPTGALGQTLQKMSPIGGATPAGRGLTATGLGIGAAGASAPTAMMGYDATKGLLGSKPQPPAAAPEPAAALEAPTPAAPAPAPAQQPGGLSGGTKAMLAAGGVGLGAMGAGAMIRKSRKKKEKQSMDYKELAVRVMRRACHTKAAALMRKQAADVLCRHLDAVAARMPLEKTAAVRALQRAVAEGKDLSVAIKVAYPYLPGEQRGILAQKLVKSACDWSKKAEHGCPPGVKVEEPKTYTGGVEGGLRFMR